MGTRVFGIRYRSEVILHSLANICRVNGKFRVLICSKDTQSCKLMSTQSKLECTILHVCTYVHTVCDSLSGRVDTQFVKCEL